MSLEALFLILVSIAVGASGQLAYLFIVDHEIVRGSKQKIKELQTQLKQLKPGDENYGAAYKQIMSENSRMMKQTMKPTFITFVPFLIVFILLSSTFSYVPVSIGTPISVNLISSVNGTLSSANNCLSLNKSYSVQFTQSTLTQSMPVTVNASDCVVYFSSANSTQNASIGAIVGANNPKSYNVGGLNMKFIPNSLIIASLPFSIPFIGNKINWFWAYIIVSFVTSITLQRVFSRLKWTA